MGILQRLLRTKGADGALCSRAGCCRLVGVGACIEGGVYGEAEGRPAVRRQRQRSVGFLSAQARFLGRALHPLPCDAGGYAFVMTLLASLVETSQRVGATSGRLAKVRE